MKAKYIIMPNITLGETVVNYIVDYYIPVEITVMPGILSAGGSWHKPPVYKNELRFCNSTIMSKERLDHYLSLVKDDADIEFIK